MAKYYLGATSVRKGQFNEYQVFEIFTSRKRPTEETHGHLYMYAIGPFDTRAEANKYADRRMGDMVVVPRGTVTGAKKNPKIPEPVLRWRETLPKGSIMKKQTFQKIVKGAKAAGYRDPLAVAGKAYWRTLMAKYREAHPGTKFNPFWAFSGYDRKKKHREKRVYEYMSLEEAKALRPGDRVLFLDRFGEVREARVNGRPRTWKTRPGDLDVPLKYGFWEYFTARFRDGMSDGQLVVRAD